MAGDWFFFSFSGLISGDWIVVVLVILGFCWLFVWCFVGNFLVMRLTEDFLGIFWIGFHGEGRGR